MADPHRTAQFFGEGNGTLETVLHRRSVRSFTDQTIDSDAWHAILEAGRLSPSTVNLQTWTFLHFDAAAWPDVWARLKGVDHMESAIDDLLHSVDLYPHRNKATGGFSAGGFHHHSNGSANVGA